MYPPNTYCFDLEIINAIPDKGQVPEPGVRYCKGWNDHAGMGVSVLVAAKVGPVGEMLHTEVFLSENFEECSKPYNLLDRFAKTVAEADLLIGHCSRQFDAKVLAAKGIYIDDRKHLDFYHEIKRSTQNQFPKGYNLNMLSQRCGGPAKTDDGARAPHMWQAGEKQRVIDYCINDILMTCAIAHHYAMNGAKLPSLDPAFAVQLRHPQQIKENG